MSSEQTPNPLPADHAEMPGKLRKMAEWLRHGGSWRKWYVAEQFEQAATLITSQAEEIAEHRSNAEAYEHIFGPKSYQELQSDIERITKERDEARIWHEKAHTFLEERNAYKHRAEAAEASLASMTERCKELAQMLDLFTRHYEDWMDRYPDSTPSSSHSWHTFGDLRRARALSQTAKEGTDENGCH